MSRWRLCSRSDSVPTIWPQFPGVRLTFAITDPNNAAEQNDSLCLRVVNQAVPTARTWPFIARYNGVPTEFGTSCLWRYRFPAPTAENS
jgi:hypothetical protein